MPTYTFTSPFPEVFSDLTNGPCTVVHADGSTDPEGSTVLLRPGDTITTPDSYEHAHLEPVSDTPSKPAKPTDVPPVADPPTGASDTPPVATETKE